MHWEGRRHDVTVAAAHIERESGKVSGFRGSGPDQAGAASCLRAARPALQPVFGFGLYDGATAIALFGNQAGLPGLIPVNPWLVEAKAGEPPPAAIRAIDASACSASKTGRDSFAQSVLR